MHCYANFVGDKWHSMKKAMLYAKGFHTSQVILTFSIYLFHFIASARNLRQTYCSIVITKAAAFRFRERACIILTNEE